MNLLVSILASALVGLDEPPEVWPDAPLLMEPAEHYWRCWPAYPIPEPETILV